jgi:putative membrane protein
MIPRERTLVLMFIVIVGLLAATAIKPYDRSTWLMEVAPVLIAGPVLVLTYRRFPLTPLLYLLIFLHAIVLITGGAYTYARVPLGFWLQDIFSLSRNHYDRIGHFFQGLVPALLAREILLRGGFVTNRRMAAFLAICIAMAISAWYELIEWAAALILGQGADDFLGTQGDPWDTQWDMFMCFIGSVAAMLTLSREQDRQMEKYMRFEPYGWRRP